MLTRGVTRPAMLDTLVTIMLRGRQSHLSIIVLAAWLFAAAGVPADWVVCYGQNGHIAVERAHVACDADDAPTAPTAKSVSNPGDAPCSDVPLAPDHDPQWTVAPPRPEAAGPTDLLLVTAWFDADPFAGLAALEPAARPVASDPPRNLLRLRTVILRL